MGREGLEPPNPMGADLQSAVFTNFTIFPNLMTQEGLEPHIHNKASTSCSFGPRTNKIA